MFGLIASHFAGAVMAFTVIVGGSYIGPDYVMNVSQDGPLGIVWNDGSMATGKLLVQSTLNDGTPVFFGKIIASSDDNKVSSGDTIAMYRSNTGTDHLMMFRGNTSSVRWQHDMCWQGFNLPTGSYIIPTTHGCQQIFTVPN